MQLFDTYHKHRFHDLITSDFWLFELSIWLHVLARSLIAVFVPIILLITGFSLTEVLVYYLIYHAIDVMFNFWARAFVAKYGARMTIVVANVATIIFFLLLSQVTVGAWGLLLAMAFFAAIYDTFFWVAHLFLFIKSSDKKERSSKDTSILYIVKRVASLLGPLVGAATIVFASEDILIVAAVIIFALSIIPLLRAKDLPDKPTHKQLTWREFFGDIQERVNFLSFNVYTLHRFNEGFFWPIFIFTVIGTIESVAFVPVIVSLAAIFFSYLAGKISKCDYKKTIIIFGLAIACVWLSRLHFQNEIFLYVSVFLVGIFSIFIDLPLDSKIFARAKTKDPLSAMMWRNTVSMGIRVPLLAIVLLLINIFNVSFAIAVIGLTLLIIIQMVLMRVYIEPECVKPIR